MAIKGKVIESRESIGTMGTWKTRVMEKGRRASRTTGKEKGIVPSALARHMCRCNRSWKHRDYSRIMATLGVRKKK